MNSTTVRPTTVIRSSHLCEHLDLDVTIASETFQHTGSFKFRAAYHLASNVSHNHILAASSGNFGQALAYACRLLGKRCTIVMPHTSAIVKVDAIRGFGGVVELVDVRQISRAARIAELEAEFPDAYVASAYDDELVIEGNSTLGIELAAIQPEIDVVVAPVGGGGLTAGLLHGLRQAGSRAQLIGAEPLLANDAARSLREGRLIANDSEPPTLADGARTVSLGQRNWAILKDGLAGIVEVPEDRIRQAVRLLFSLANLKCEPTGALSIAALLTAPDRFRNRQVGCVVSGGNVDPSLYCNLIAATNDTPKV